MKKKLLWVGDAGCPSGFGRATHGILETLHREYDVTVLGINYVGDPGLGGGFDSAYPYPIYAAIRGGDAIGVGRIVWMCDKIKPDVIVLQNDGWNIAEYVQVLRNRRPNGEYRFPEHARIPLIAAVAIDGRNFCGSWLDGIDASVFWTQFAFDEARVGGYLGFGVVIPLGVDLNIYYPEEKRAARERVVPSLRDAFIIGNVNRNQPRKRWDLMLKYFAEWRYGSKVNDAWLYLHVAPTGDMMCDILQLASYYGVKDRLALMQPPIFYGVSEDGLRDTYNCLDVYASTTQGEGMGLPAMEAMACGVPCVLPDWAAYGDWARGACISIPCYTTAIGPPYVNVIGGVPDEEEFKIALDDLYQDRNSDYGKLGLERVSEMRFRWEHIGREWLHLLEKVIEEKEELNGIEDERRSSDAAKAEADRQGFSAEARNGNLHGSPDRDDRVEATVSSVAGTSATGSGAGNAASERDCVGADLHEEGQTH